MLRQPGRVVVSALLALVVFAGSAAAECAWVLWSNIHTVTEVMPDRRFTSTFDANNHIPQSSFLTLEACNSEKRRVEQPIVAPSVGDIYKQYRCLPDTVDPRGPKGGGR